jgi:hypothetical protein
MAGRYHHRQPSLMLKFSRSPVSRIDGCCWTGLDRSMPIQNVAAILEEILSEADALIRLRLKSKALSFRTWSSARLPTIR